MILSRNSTWFSGNYGIAEIVAIAYQLEQVGNGNAATPPTADKLTLEQVMAPLKSHA